ncbi:MAG TPA: HAMP domain-containing sensor histidine kinase [Deltaproteobacteria bacterium]|nr:HAMP domain-containing sensor histidine kinase [Deltaproteobacteria bacterium]HRR21756.1 HAMP domain-containing sensor histidine kinase [Desulfomonilia bacterium]
MEKSIKDIYREFVAHMVHDLKSPTIAIGGYAHRLRSGRIGELNEEQKHALDVIIENSKRLEHDLHMILEYFQTDKDLKRMQPPERIEVRALLEEQVESYRIEAQEKEISLELDVPAEPIVMEGYPHHLSKAVLNLIDNALKYTPRKGSVTVSASSSGDLVSIDVQDTGRGFRQQDLDMMFQKFEDVMDIHDREIRGFGLGLSNVKRYVDMHHGEIRVQSREGEGSTFTLILPVHMKDRE